MPEIEGIELFGVGRYEQEDGSFAEYDARFLDGVLANYERLSTGRTPMHRIPVVAGHKSEEALAWISGLKRGQVHEGRRRVAGLIGNMADVAPTLATALRDKRYRKISVEFKDNFRDNQGRSYGPCLWRVAVLGASVPRVKGLKDIPAVTFADRGRGGISYFAELESTTMDIAAAQAFLKSKGIDAAALDDPEKLAIAVAEAWQAEESGEEPIDPSKRTFPGKPQAGMAHGRAKIATFSHGKTNVAALRLRTQRRYEEELARHERQQGRKPGA